MIKYKKAIWIQIVCAIIIIVTTIYLAPRLYGFEKVAWGLFGFAILIGSLVEAYKDIDKAKQTKQPNTSEEKNAEI